MWKMLTILLCVCALAGVAASAAADSTPPACTSTLFPSPNERFGFGVKQPSGCFITSNNVPRLNAGWYLDWTLNPNAQHPGDILGVHEIRFSPEGLHVNPADVARIADEDFGALWILGNEPDVVAQDNVTPSQYATQYYQAYHLIKGYDPTAQVAAGGGICQPTPLRLGWLSAVWDAYQALYGNQMPADVWNIHNFIMQEKMYDWGCGIPPGYYGRPGATYPVNSHDNLTIFVNHVRAMRRWMSEHGQRNKPLIISEYGILFPVEQGFDVPRVETFLEDTTNWMLTESDPELGYPADDNHLVQRWLWYSLDDDNFEGQGTTAGALMNPDTCELLPMGSVFAGQTAPLVVPYVNLVVARVQMATLDGSAVSTSVAQQITVTATIQNRGNSALSRPFRVAIRDQSATEIYSTTVNGIPDRYRGNVIVQTTWRKPAGTNWRLDVVVDPDNAIAESDECDNQGTASSAADLSLTALTINDAQGQAAGAQGTDTSVGLTAEVENLGGMELTGVVTRLWNGTRLLDKITLPRLAPQAHAEVAFAWVNAQTGFYTLTAELVLPAGVSDPIESNNRLSRQVIIGGRRTYQPVMTIPEDPPGPECRNVLVNPGFETGTLAGWQASRFVWIWGLGNCYAGNYCAWMGQGWDGQADLSQSVTIPSVAVAQEMSVTLTYAWAVTTTKLIEPSETCTVEIRSAVGEPPRTIQILDNRDVHKYWYTTSADISEFAGQTIQLHFHASNYIESEIKFFFDEVSIEVCEQR